MKRVNGIDEAFLVPNSDAVLPDEKELRVGDDKLLAISRANGKGPKPAAQPLFQFLHVHMPNVNPPLNLVKIPNHLPSNSHYGSVNPRRVRAPGLHPHKTARL